MNQTLNRDDLIKRMDLDGIPTDMQDQIIAELGENILKSVTLEVFSILSPEDKISFEELLKKNIPADIENFLVKKVPNLNTLIKQKTETKIEAVRKAMVV